MTIHVLPEHAERARRFMAFAARWTMPFMIMLVLLVLAVIAGAAVGSSRIAALGVVGLGALSIAFPFTTPQTMAAFGMARSIRIARTIGVVTVLAGALVLVLPRL